MVGYMILFSKKLKLGRRYKGPRECGNETKRGKAWPSKYAWIEEWVGHENNGMWCTQHVPSMHCLDHGMHLQ